MEQYKRKTLHSGMQTYSRGNRLGHVSHGIEATWVRGQPQSRYTRQSSEILDNMSFLRTQMRVLARALAISVRFINKWSTWGLATWFPNTMHAWCRGYVTGGCRVYHITKCEMHKNSCLFWQMAMPQVAPVDCSQRFKLAQATSPIALFDHCSQGRFEEVDSTPFVIQKPLGSVDIEPRRTLGHMVLTIYTGWYNDQIYENLPVVSLQSKCRATLAQARMRYNKLRFEDLLPGRSELSLTRLQSACRRFIVRQHFSLQQIALRTRSLDFAFPKIGDDNWGCDCWLPDPANDSSIPSNIIKLLYLDSPPPPRKLLGSIPSWRIHYATSNTVHVVTHWNNLWSVHIATDCHLSSEATRSLGHQYRERVVVRDNHGDLVVLACLATDFLRLLPVDDDQHLLVANMRSFVAPPSLPIQQQVHASITSNPEDIVTRQGIAMSRQEKASLRSIARREAKEAKRLGVVEKKKKFQVPLRFRGLTTQEYHEAIKREHDDLVAWVNSQGRRAQPQAVQEYLKSPGGHEIWYKIHNFAVTREELATQQLAKLNLTLRKYYGLIVDLQLSPHLVEKIRNQQERMRELRDRQLSAAALRPSKYGRAHNQSQTAQIEREIQAFRAGAVASSSHSGAKMWADYEEEDELPDIPTWD